MMATMTQELQFALPVTIPVPLAQTQQLVSPAPPTEPKIAFSFASAIPELLTRDSLLRVPLVHPHASNARPSKLARSVILQSISDNWSALPVSVLLGTSMPHLF